MKKRGIYTDKFVNDIISEAINSLINERKVIKVGNGGKSNEQGSLMNTMTPSMPPPMPPQPMDGGQPPMDGGQLPMDGGQPPMDGENEMPNQFDNNFDAGVEADEDADPYHYIQQLTGKLSQKIGSYISENNGNNEGEGSVPSVCKYVAKMIIKQTVKGLDENGRKELIKTINMANAENDEMDDEEGMDDMSDDGMDMNPEQDGDQMMPIQERIMSKRQLLESINSEMYDDYDEDERVEYPRERNRKKNNPLNGKNFEKMPKKKRWS